jgi:sigma-B regulation protein RsbU (phosphoserine phosphatase)
VDLFAVLEPAKEVGGDLYDFLLQDGQLFFAVGDVSGKGIPASLCMAVTRSIFRSAVQHLSDPVAIVTSINDSLSQDNDANMFVTLFVGVIDLATHHFRYCNAGHTPPVLFGETGPAFLKLKPNLAVGIRQGFVYKGAEMDLPQRETLFLYTDGLTEAMNNESDLYGNPRVIESLQRFTDATVKDMVQGMAGTVLDFAEGAEQSDDLTLLAIRLLPHWTVVESRRENIEPLLAQMEAVLEKWEVPLKAARQIEVAFEELFVNVVHYAYPEAPGNIWVSFGESGGFIIFEIQDEGIPFDPTARPDPDISLPANERPIGGLGIFMVKKSMDEFSYSRQDGKNCVRVKKRIG